MKRVNVLISTYNGEKFIEDQIESILNQTYTNIKIYVRDDGSTDKTIEMLKKYEAESKITLILGDNKKWGRSFMTLLSMSGDGDLWAFSDQDDVWYPEKTTTAVEWFDKQDNTKPLLYGCSYELTNADMSVVTGVHTPPSYKFDFRRALTDCLYQGFVCVLNEPLRELMLKAEIENISSHDWWACILAAKFGETYFEPQIGAKHRRLDTSMSSSTLKSKIAWFKKSFSSGNTDIGSCAREYIRVFGDKYQDKDRKIASWFAGSKYSLKSSVCKAFYPKKWRPGVASEVSIRILMLFGKI